MTAHAIEILGVDDCRVTLRVHCSAGFYVRALAHDLGERLGTGAHLTALRRTRSGRADLAHAVGLADVERDPDSAARLVVPPAEMLPDLPALVLTLEGARRAMHGRDLGPGDAMRSPGELASLVRLLDSAGDLVGIAEAGPAPGLLHPFVVLK